MTYKAQRPPAAATSINRLIDLTNNMTQAAQTLPYSGRDCQQMAHELQQTLQHTLRLANDEDIYLLFHISIAPKLIRLAKKPGILPTNE